MAAARLCRWYFSPISLVFPIGKVGEGKIDWMLLDSLHSKKPAFARASGYFWTSLNNELVEAAGIEPASRFLLAKPLRHVFDDDVQN